jgi:triosephosphate isomerase
MRRPIVVGNWKMNGSLADNAKLLAALKERSPAGVDAGVCVPFPYLAQVQGLLQGSPLAWGGQDLSVHASGAYTGEVSAAMLKDFGCTLAIVGHSERRQYHAETSAQVAVKAQVALAAGLLPIVCVGETLDERDAGLTEQVVRQQLEPVLALGADVVGRLVIAYEPVWAIGTGRTATPEQAQAVHAAIRRELAGLSPAVADAVRIQYGGSVKAGNAAELFSMPDIDGGLIGGASLVAEDFLAILAAAKPAA